MSEFFNASKELVNNFLQNVVFIDDKAFDDSGHQGQHNFDAYSVTQAFAINEKICAIYGPKTLNDVENLVTLTRKADITVLDWQIDIPLAPPPVEEEEDEVVEIDPRGVHTLRIIREILFDPIVIEGSLKLILIYTGETDLDGIAEKIRQDLESNGIKNISKDFCEVCIDNIKVLVIAKTDPTKTPEEQFPYNPTLQHRIKSYDELPNYIIERFTEMTTGLLSNFALRSLTVIRQNTFKFIKLYNKALDKAFLAHRLLLPEQEDSKDLLVELFSNSIQSLLAYSQAGETVNTKQVLDWIDTQTFTGQLNSVAKNTLQLNNDLIKSWSEHGFVKACVAFWQSNGFGEVDSQELNKALRNLKGHFLSGDKNDKNDIQFSILTHHKSIFKPDPISPKLTLGAVIKGSRTGYWVCIQQRCDSVRIEGERRFLFLPLEPLTPESNANFHFVTQDGVRLKLRRKSYELRTIKFAPNNPEGVIKSIKEGDKFVFHPLYKNGHEKFKADEDEVYEWILDLKDLHAQRIAIDFASELSRVGLDEAEWLRRGSSPK